MNHSLPTLGLGSAAALGAAALVSPAAQAQQPSADQFTLALGTDGHPTITEPLKKKLQGVTPAERQGAIEFDLVAGDELSVGAVGPEREFTGKRVTFDIEALIVEEHRRNCGKVEDRRPYQEPGHERGPTLALGRQVKVLVEIHYGQKKKVEILEATFNQPATRRLEDSAKVRVRVIFDPDEVALVPREITEAEQQMYVNPAVDELRRDRPTYRDARATNQRVEAGDLNTLAVTAKISRDQ